MAVTLGSAMLDQYDRFSLYNSPYVAHDDGRAIDLYPGRTPSGRKTIDGQPTTGRKSTDGKPTTERTIHAPSPVSGTVIETTTVGAPSKPYAPPEDHLLLVACDGPAAVAGLTARLLHVDPIVDPGDRIEIGDGLGSLVRAGFFAPWVANHLHLEFRDSDRDPYRASGSNRIELAADVDLRPVSWDGHGTVREVGDTYVVLDEPAHPDPGEYFVGIEADDGGVIDGGLPHYDGGGLLCGPDGLLRGPDGQVNGPDGQVNGPDGPVTLTGDRVGIVAGRTITWDALTVLANDDPVTGLSLFCAKDEQFGAKLICPDRSFDVGAQVRIEIRDQR